MKNFGLLDPAAAQH